jgi:hypothetical protein
LLLGKYHPKMKRNSSKEGKRGFSFGEGGSPKQMR